MAGFDDVSRGGRAGERRPRCRQPRRLHGAVHLLSATPAEDAEERPTRRPPQAERRESAKLRINRALNQSGPVGRAFGSRFGIVAMLFTRTESFIRDQCDVADDWVNTVAAGASAGALYRIASGPRSMIVAGILGGVLSGAAVAGKPMLQRFAPKLSARLDYLL
nr:mitochondrial import inner membrane translocase subunit TIM23-3-like [Oryza sativa Japonica Group]